MAKMIAFDEEARNSPRARRCVVELDQWSWTCIRSAMASTQARKGPRIFSETNGATGTASRRTARQEIPPSLLPPPPRHACPCRGRRPARRSPSVHTIRDPDNRCADSRRRSIFRSTKRKSALNEQRFKRASR